MMFIPNAIPSNEYTLSGKSALAGEKSRSVCRNYLRLSFGPIPDRYLHLNKIRGRLKLLARASVGGLGERAYMNRLAVLLPWHQWQSMGCTIEGDEVESFRPARLETQDLP